MRLDKHVCKSGCVINSSQTTFSVYGNRTAYILQNPGKKNVSKYIVDDCLLADLQADEKCDYLFVVKNGEKNNGYFVELKGGDIPKAISQLINSISHLKNDIDGGYFGRIICSKFRKAPEIKSSHSYIRLMKLTETNLTIKSQQLTEIV